ncbi:MAG TPA: Verru_Chthon cassette protein A, partial [Candidatus Methylacidiphilales bacterium]
MKSRRPRSGFILVSVLAILGLLVLLVVAFLARAGTERVSSAGYRASLASRQLADTAVNFVEGEINLATAQGSGVSWASQPGMVRTFDSGGNLLSVYKLYSAPNLIATTSGIANGKSSDAPPPQWAASPAIWTDLNAPVKNPGGQKVFPILDPGAASSGVAGYAVANAPGATSYQPVPMPVTWLYVLEDGTLVAPTGTGKTALVAGEGASNRIVGRIAFWTDDETCKVNVNTAGAGAFWDLPRAYNVIKASNVPPTWGAPSPAAGTSVQEQALGYYQPAQKEFQRYPGHPAMTDLRAVFPAMTADQVFALSPRLLSGGTKQGTVQVASGTAPSAYFPGYPKTDRLYSGLDELLFSPARATNAGLTPTQLQQTKFFLTAHSRAPETNLFNLPRVDCWPIHADLAANPASAYATAFDRLVALCSSTGTSGNAAPYYFQRKDSTTVSTDIGIARNQALYAYLQYLTAQAVPGFGGDFLTKYGGDRDQILTEIFDYVRTVDLCDTNLAAANQYAPNGSVAPTVYGATQGFGRFPTISKVAIGFICNADGSVPSSASASGSTANLALGGAALPAGQRVIQAIVIPEFFSPALGFIGLAPTMQLSSATLDSFSVNNTALFPAAANTTATYGKAYPDAVFFAGWGTGSTRYGGNPGWRAFLLQSKSPTRARSAPQRGAYPADGTADDPYPFIGNPVRITP